MKNFLSIVAVIMVIISFSSCGYPPVMYATGEYQYETRIVAPQAPVYQNNNGSGYYGQSGQSSGGYYQVPVQYNQQYYQQSCEPQNGYQNSTNRTPRRGSGGNSPRK